MTLVNLDGTPMRAAPKAETRTTSYVGADWARAETRGWNVRLTSPDREILPERADLVARQRDLARNDAFVRGAIQTSVDRTIGATWSVQSMPDYRALGLSPDWGYEFGRAAERVFRNWHGDPRKFHDAAEHQTWPEMCGMAWSGIMLDGEAVAVLRSLDRGAPLTTAVQMVDPDRLGNPDGRPDEDLLRGGVSLNDAGAAIGYHFRDAHPGDIGASWRSVNYTYIPRRTNWGRAMVVHWFRKLRPDQHRGVSPISALVELAAMTGKYKRSEVQSAVLSASLPFFLRGAMPDQLGELFGDASDEGIGGFGKLLDTRGEFYRDHEISVDGASIPRLFSGDEVVVPETTRPHAGLWSFYQVFLRHLAIATGGTYEQISRDWSQVNYSSARAALNEAFLYIQNRRAEFGAGFCRPIYAAVLEEAIDTGLLRLPPGAPDFWDGFAAYTRCYWLGPGRLSVDETKEADASGKKVEQFLSSPQDEAAAMGRDFEEILDDHARAARMMQERGLTRVSTTGYAAPQPGNAAVSAA